VVLRLASYNVQSGRGRTGGYDADALTRSVQALGADLVALQEIDHVLPRSGGRDQLGDLASALSRGGERWTGHFLPTVLGSPGLVRSWRPAESPEIGEGQPAYGIGLVTRLPVTAWHSLRLRSYWGRLPMLVPTPRGRPVPMLVPDEPRGVLGAEVETELGALTVLGTHLSFLPPRGALQLRRLVGWSRSLPGPRILLGDLNLPGALPSAVTGWRRLADGATFPASAPRNQLDHALADGLDPAVRATAHTVEGEVSDHRAVVVELSRP
jgi:endonuclease/exonuclease/phosphatase family metal-dependent hydrolase